MKYLSWLFMSAGLFTVSYGQNLRHVDGNADSAETDLLLTSFVTTAVAEEIPSALPDEVGMHATRLKVIDEVVEEGLRRAKMPGCVVLVGHQGHVVYHKAFGHLQLVPEKLPMKPDTVFDMASLTKPIATATSVMTLVECGQVDLRAPVAKYIPEFGVNGKEHITVRQLLIHSGGLIPDNEIEDYANGPTEAFRKIYALGTYVEPGTEFVYTDVGFIVLAEMVHRITGKIFMNTHRTESFDLCV